MESAAGNRVLLLGFVSNNDTLFIVGVLNLSPLSPGDGGCSGVECVWSMCGGVGFTRAGDKVYLHLSDMR